MSAGRGAAGGRARASPRPLCVCSRPAWAARGSPSLPRLPVCQRLCLSRASLVLVSVSVSPFLQSIFLRVSVPVSFCLSVTFRRLRVRINVGVSVRQVSLASVRLSPSSCHLIFVLVPVFSNPESLSASLSLGLGSAPSPRFLS